MLIDAGEERRDAAAMLGDWRIKAAGIDALPDSLSGGNQQKVVVAKWMATKPRVLLLDEPTKGVDVGAKFEIHEMIRQQARDGLAVLVVSSDLPEILALADRILVMKEGELQGELDGATATEEAVMRLATHPSTHRPAAPVDSLRAGDRMKQLRAIRELSTVAILIAEVLFFAWYLWPEAGRAHPFLNAENALLILKYSSIYGIAAVGAAVVIISGGIDLAPGAVIALAGVVTGHLLRRRTTGRSRRASPPACRRRRCRAC